MNIALLFVAIIRLKKKTNKIIRRIDHINALEHTFQRIYRRRVMANLVAFVVINLFTIFL